ncbi:hypothetical protein CR513_55736, partial [Mucuna pruriens]
MSGEVSDTEDSDEESKYHVHVFLQRLYGGRIMTIIDGINRRFDYYRILRDLELECYSRGRVVIDPVLGKVIELYGDCRYTAARFLEELSFKLVVKF